MDDPIIKRGDIKRFREHLNAENAAQIARANPDINVMHRNGPYQQRKRLYGDYLYACDREKFMFNLVNWLKSQPS